VFALVDSRPYGTHRSRRFRQDLAQPLAALCNVRVVDVQRRASLGVRVDTVVAQLVADCASAALDVLPSGMRFHFPQRDGIDADVVDQSPYASAEACQDSCGFRRVGSSVKPVESVHHHCTVRSNVDGGPT